MTINDLFLEAVQARDRFWFVQSFEVVERTAQTITLHFVIQPTLFVQVYYSVRSGRFNFAMIVGHRDGFMGVIASRGSGICTHLDNRICTSRLWKACLRSPFISFSPKLKPFCLRMI